MLWLLKRTVSMRQFLRAPNYMLKKWWVRKYLQFYAENMCLSKLMSNVEWHQYQAMVFFVDAIEHIQIL